MRKKNSYHTNIAFKVQTGLLSEKEKSCIPTSTFYDMRKRDLSNVIGFDSDDKDLFKEATLNKIIDSKSFKTILRGLILAFRFYYKLADTMKGKRKIWNMKRSEIAALVTRLSSIFGVKRTCKLMKISVP
ncbi:transposase, partial [Leptospira perolatii]